MDNSFFHQSLISQCESEYETDEEEDGAISEIWQKACERRANHFEMFLKKYETPSKSDIIDITELTIVKDYGTVKRSYTKKCISLYGRKSKDEKQQLKKLVKEIGSFDEAYDSEDISICENKKRSMPVYNGGLYENSINPFAKGSEAANTTFVIEDSKICSDLKNMHIESSVSSSKEEEKDRKLNDISSYTSVLTRKQVLDFKSIKTKSVVDSQKNNSTFMKNIPPNLLKDCIVLCEKIDPKQYFKRSVLCEKIDSKINSNFSYQNNSRSILSQKNRGSGNVISFSYEQIEKIKYINSCKIMKHRKNKLHKNKDTAQIKHTAQIKQDAILGVVPERRRSQRNIQKTSDSAIKSTFSAESTCISESSCSTGNNFNTQNASICSLVNDTSAPKVLSPSKFFPKCSKFKKNLDNNSDKEIYFDDKKTNDFILCKSDILLVAKENSKGSNNIKINNDSKLKSKRDDIKLSFPEIKDESISSNIFKNYDDILDSSKAVREETLLFNISNLNTTEQSGEKTLLYNMSDLNAAEQNGDETLLYNMYDINTTELSSEDVNIRTEKSNTISDETVNLCAKMDSINLSSKVSSIEDIHKNTNAMPLGMLDSIILIDDDETEYEDHITEKEMQHLKEEDAAFCSVSKNSSKEMSSKCTKIHDISSINEIENQTSDEKLFPTEPLLIEKSSETEGVFSKICNKNVMPSPKNLDLTLCSISKNSSKKSTPNYAEMHVFFSSCTRKESQAFCNKVLSMQPVLTEKVSEVEVVCRENYNKKVMPSPKNLEDAMLCSTSNNSSKKNTSLCAKIHTSFSSTNKAENKTFGNKKLCSEKASEAEVLAFSENCNKKVTSSSQNLENAMLSFTNKNLSQKISSSCAKTYTSFSSVNKIENKASCDKKCSVSESTEKVSKVEVSSENCNKKVMSSPKNLEGVTLCSTSKSPGKKNTSQCAKLHTSFSSTNKIENKTSCDKKICPTEMLTKASETEVFSENFNKEVTSSPQNLQDAMLCSTKKNSSKKNVSKCAKIRTSFSSINEIENQTSCDKMLFSTKSLLTEKTSETVEAFGENYNRKATPSPKNLDVTLCSISKNFSKKITSSYAKMHASFSSVNKKESQTFCNEKVLPTQPMLTEKVSEVEVVCKENYNEEVMSSPKILEDCMLCSTSKNFSKKMSPKFAKIHTFSSANKIENKTSYDKKLFLVESALTEKASKTEDIFSENYDKKFMPSSKNCNKKSKARQQNEVKNINFVPLDVNNDDLILLSDEDKDSSYELPALRKRENKSTFNKSSWSMLNKVDIDANLVSNNKTSKLLNESSRKHKQVHNIDINRRQNRNDSYLHTKYDINLISDDDDDDDDQEPKVSSDCSNVNSFKNTHKSNDLNSFNKDVSDKKFESLGYKYRKSSYSNSSSLKRNKYIASYLNSCKITKKYS